MTRGRVLAVLSVLAFLVAFGIAQASDYASAPLVPTTATTVAEQGRCGR